MACKLVAVAQCKGEPSLEPVVRGLPNGEVLPLADFHYDLVPDTAPVLRALRAELDAAA